MIMFRRQALLLPLTFGACYLIPPGLKTFHHRWIIRRGLDNYISKIITNRFESAEHAKEAKHTRKRHFVVDYAIDTWRQELVNKQGTPQAAKLDSKTLDNIISQ